MRGLPEALCLTLTLHSPPRGTNGTLGKTYALLSKGGMNVTITPPFWRGHRLPFGSAIRTWLLSPAQGRIAVAIWIFSVPVAPRLSHRLAGLAKSSQTTQSFDAQSTPKLCSSPPLCGSHDAQRGYTHSPSRKACRAVALLSYTRHYADISGREEAVELLHVSNLPCRVAPSADICTLCGRFVLCGSADLLAEVVFAAEVKHYRGGNVNG